MAEVKKEIGKLGETYITVIFNDAEKEALTTAHEIVMKRFAEENLELLPDAVQKIDNIFQGMLRFEGIDALLEYAKTAKILK